MTCEQLQPDYELYALGTLDGVERDELDAHLARQCPACTAGVSRARALLTHLAFTAPPVDPPPHVRSHLMRTVAQSAPRHLSFWESAFWRLAFPVSAIGAVAMLAVAGGLYMEVRGLNSEIRTLRTTVEEQRTREQELTTQISRYRDALAMLASRGVREVRFGPQAPAGRVFLDPRGAVLVATNLPKPPAGRVYEMWLLLARRPAPVPAGVFELDPKGSAVHVFGEPIEVAQVRGIAISDEPPGGVPAPTGKVIVLVAPK
jgi:anti-sigma-K factor RskA